MKRLIYILIAFMTALAAQGRAQFALQEPQNAVVGRPYRVTYIVSTDDQAELNSLDFNEHSHPEIKGMKFHSGPGVSTGFQSSWVNGVSSQSFTAAITYTYYPEAEGNATIPAMSVKVGGRTLTSRSATIRVLPGGGNVAAQGGPGSRRPQARQEQVTGSSVGTTTPRDLMVIITFSRRNVYEMEPVVADIKLCLKLDRRFSIGDQFNSVSLPVFDGFIAEDLPVPQRSTTENIGGTNYETLVLRRYLLYPQKAGRLQVSSGQYEIDVLEYETVTRGFFTSHREVPRKMNTATNTVTLDVKPLPEPRPAGFSGAVGRFTAQAEINPEIIRSNESATYSLVIKGSGNIKYLNAPTVTFPSTFETYTATTDIEANFDGINYAGTFRADYPFVPQEVGQAVIEPFEFVYFDPAAGEYRTATTRGFDINVLRGNGPAMVAAQREVDTRMTDILHIRPLGAAPATAPATIFGSWWYRLIYLIVAAALVTVVLVYRSHVRRSADVAGRRHARASRVATRRFRAARALMRRHSAAAFYDELARALKGYLSDKLGIAPSGLITDTITERLTARGVDPATVADVLAVLNDCEMARFTPMDTDDAMADVLTRAEQAVKAIEDVKSAKNA